MALLKLDVEKGGLGTGEVAKQVQVFGVDTLKLRLVEFYIVNEAGIDGQEAALAWVLTRQPEFFFGAVVLRLNRLAP